MDFIHKLREYILPSLTGRWTGVGLLFACFSLGSCGLLDFDADEFGAQTAAEMVLEQDTFYVVRGDTFSINPVFTPDTINITDLYFLPVYNNVVEVCGVDKLAAVGEGWTKVYIMSVSARIADSCMVYVMEPWILKEKVWPYETVFYSNVTVNGQPLTEDMEVAAFIGDECRGIGIPKTYIGISMIQFRVGSENSFEGGNGDVNWDDGEEGEYDAEYATDEHIYRERITFRCYDHRTHHLYFSKQHEDFDGETHGTLSNLYEINF